jgi:hypothetical protein
MKIVLSRGDEGVGEVGGDISTYLISLIPLIS